MKAEEDRQTLAALLRAQPAGEGEPPDELPAAQGDLSGPAADFTLLHATADVLMAALRQGLGYTLSIAAIGVPKEKCALLRAWVAGLDPDVRHIIEEHLRQSRLRRLCEQYPECKSLTV